MATIRFQIAPDVEFNMDVELEGVSAGSRDYDVQQHKAEVYEEFERRLKEASLKDSELTGLNLGRVTKRMTAGWERNRLTDDDRLSAWRRRHHREMIG